MYAIARRSFLGVLAYQYSRPNSLQRYFVYCQILMSKE